MSTFNIFEKDLLDKPDYEGLRATAVKRLDEYVQHGHVPQSHFLRALLENDFVKIMSYADEQTRQHLDGYAKLMNCRMPANCWGSQEKVSAWAESGGTQG